MRQIDLETWPRRQQFEFFSTMDSPHFGMCANVDLAAFHPAVKERGTSFTVAMTYLLTRVANETPEFRTRIRGVQVVEHEVVHPGATILVSEDLFSFAYFTYAREFDRFAPMAAEEIARVQEHPDVSDEPGRDDLLYMTSIPWVSFTGFMHPLHLSPVDSVPRFAWGKYFQEGEALKMPLNVQAHHALMDGLHMGRYYEKVQDYLHHPDVLLGDA